MNKTKPIRVFTCPKCGRILVKRTRHISVTSNCVKDTPDGEHWTPVKMIAHGQQQRTN